MVRWAQMLRAWDMAAQMEGFRDRNPPTLAAGVLMALDCGVICGVGREANFGREGSWAYGFGSRVGKIVLGPVGVWSLVDDSGGGGGTLDNLSGIGVGLGDGVALVPDMR